MMDNARSAEATAELFGVHPSTIRSLAAAREIPHLKIGRRYVFTEDHVDAIRAHFEVPATPVRQLTRRVS